MMVGSTEKDLMKAGLLVQQKPMVCQTAEHLELHFLLGSMMVLMMVGSTKKDLMKAGLLVQQKPMVCQTAEHLELHFLLGSMTAATWGFHLWMG
jgi:hypothetical protein